MEALPLVTQQETIACGLLADRHRRPPECVAIVQNRRSISAFSAEGIVRDALAFVERKGANNIQVKDLTNAVRVKYRTLLRAFQRHLQMTPKRYLRLRQLNRVRRALCAPEASSAIDIMADFGVTEFGRFATEYKRLFDELPSETMRRAGRKARRLFDECPHPYTRPGMTPDGRIPR